MDYKDCDLSFLKTFPDFDGHEKVRRFEDQESGLVAFIALHNTALGPALGGCRMYAYAGENDAVRDVLRLSRGMTYKNALAGLPFGGGKSVIVGDPRHHKSEALIRAMGKAVASLEGHYITAEDSGTNEHDMAIIAGQTPYVVGLKPEKAANPLDLGGDPSPKTAWGVFCGMKAAIERRYGSSNLAGLKVAVQGLGAVGYDLCRFLHKEGVEIVAADMRPEILAKAEKEMPGLKVVEPGAIFAVKANVFSPCALGAQINDSTVPQLQVDIVAGAANNQLAKPGHGKMLADKKILYVPDYVLNAGGVIAVGYEYFQRNKINPFNHELTSETMLRHVEQIGATLNKIFNIAESRGITPEIAADELAEARFRKLDRAGSG